jgi:uncharacterized low-complexity protein
MHSIPPFGDVNVTRVLFGEGKCGAVISIFNEGKKEKGSCGGVSWQEC